MKKTILISGIAAANIMMFGAAFKAMHWPGANILLCLAVFVFCFFFLPFGLISSYRSQDQKRYKWLSVITFIVFFIVLISALFKVMHWPGAGFWLMLSVPLPFAVFLPVYLFSIRKDKEHSLTNILGVMFGLSFIAVFSALLSLNVSRTMLENISSDIPWLEKNLAYNKARANDVTNSALVQKSDDIINYIDGLKCEIMTAAGNENCSSGKPVSGYYKNGLSGLDNTEISNVILFSGAGSSEINILKQKLGEFREFVVSHPDANENMKEFVNTIFPGISQNPSPESLSWEQIQFPTMHLIGVVDALTRIQANVRFIESELIK